MEAIVIPKIPTTADLNQELSQQMMRSCLRELNAGNRRFGTAVDSEIKMCFAKFMEAVHVVATA